MSKEMHYMSSNGNSGASKAYGQAIAGCTLCLLSSLAAIATSFREADRKRYEPIDAFGITGVAMMGVTALGILIVWIFGDVDQLPLTVRILIAGASSCHS